jgi:hypothetical protein
VPNQYYPVILPQQEDNGQERTIHGIRIREEDLDAFRREGS